jgi:hypothetical protein
MCQKGTVNHNYREWLVETAICGMLGQWPSDLYSLATFTLELLAQRLRGDDWWTHNGSESRHIEK